MNLPDSVCAGIAQISALSTWTVLLSKTTMLLAVAWLIHFALARANPRWQVLLWRGLVVGLAMLVVWCFGLPGLEVRVPALQVAERMPSPPIPTAVAGGTPSGLRQAVVLPTELPAFAEMPTTAHHASADRGKNANLPPGTPKPSPSWQATLLCIWGIGVALLLVRLAIGHMRLARRLPPNSQAVPEWVLAEVQRVAAEFACRQAVQVRSSRRFATPFLYGLRSPILVLPERMCQPAYRRQLPGIVAHELAHVRSWDFGWNVGLQIVSILLWFHPLAWRIGWAHRAACDAVCDAVSASYLGDVQGYCRTLARVALEGAASFPAAGLAMARTCDVRRRVATLKRMVFAMPLGRRAVAVTGLVGLVAAVLLAGMRLTPAQSAAVMTDGQSAASSEAKTPEDSRKDQGGPKTGTERSVKPGYRPMQIHVLERDGKPIDNARITVRGMTSLPFGPVRYRTDTKGTATIEVPKEDVKDLQILAWDRKHVTAGAVWKGNAVAAQVPEDFTFRLEQGTLFGGIVRDEQGKPIAAAEITVAGRKTSPDDPLWVSINDITKTDAEGKWQVHRIPGDLSGFDLKVKLTRPDVAGIATLDLKALPIDQLRAGSAVLVMPEGVVVEGTVTDPQGKPVPGAAVGLFADESWGSNSPRTKTDQGGHYRFAVTDPGGYTLAAAAEGYAPDSRHTTMKSEPQTVDLQLRKGEMIRLRVVDEDGEPMPEAVVSTVFNNEDPHALTMDYESSIERDHDRHMVADAEGRWSRLWIPEKELMFQIRKDGYGEVQKWLAPSEQEHVVTLEAGGWSVVGRVVDRQTKVPVTRFHVVEGYAYGSSDHDLSWRERRPVENENGRYRAAWDTSGGSHRVLRIEADGYLPGEIRRLEVDDRQVTFDVELSKGQATTGTVRSFDGKPLADAEVALCTATRRFQLQNGFPLQGQPHLIVRTGPDGRFSLPAQSEPYILVALHEKGFAQVEGEQGTKDIAIRPWARAEGTLRIGNQPGANELIRLDLGEDRFGRQDRSPIEQVAERIGFDYRTQTDAEGHFVFERVVPGSGKIHRCAVSRHGQTASVIPTHSTKVEFVAGETTQVELSRDGRPVVGKLVMAEDMESAPTWSFARISMQGADLPMPEMPLPKDLDPIKDRQAALKWWETWKETPEGKRYQEEVKQYNQDARQRQPVYYNTKVEADGSFTFDDIPAGDYGLSVQLPAPPAQGKISPGEVIATLNHAFTVPEMPGRRSDRPLELGALTLEPRGPR